ncbi:D-alanyl-D-alanine carboxypeptidase/D-alanyl-D-alanine endopeptidase [Aquibacillus rhizosphaerae]|uniref:D-alanyl-D-alanine carboxypeptidase/D-alanyl-D-alanine-endopeptidase n=1 Tax=Aquibacillus rhizosphaerae TaxID=3051431 RepID=A0ABT7L8S2_9BACI|nr:D-alanyl-D-alanine carboxypeptidase/D-alanyl-D-alanine-endopeptidase [Aquibacillus sp. LR5S19]MDL4842267.1 D-alanyl-D-alanine carboxypeptidase/D-alanyl-D-alanine-endopeptidase [Aquibacillus sp. LR5S19]
MKKHFIFLSVVFFVVFLFFIIPTLDKDSPPVKGLEGTSTMKEQLDRLIQNESTLDGAIIGISIRSASTGEIIYDHMGATRMRTASNMKLLTAAAALSKLGEAYTFSTELTTDGEITGNTLEGNLYLKGRGDPTLLQEDFVEIAKELKKKGVKVIDGNINGDDTWYDDERLSPDLVWSDEHFYYGAQVSALTASPNKDFDAGTVIVDVLPGSSKGKKAVINISPNTSYIKVINNTKTVASDEEENLIFNREHGTNTFVIEGNIPIQSGNVREWMAVWEPTGYALELFTQALEDQGILWTGNINFNPSPEDANIIHSDKSMRLSELLIPFMKLSNNGHAEILVKEMGKVETGEGSWEKGLEVVEKEAAKLGVNTDSLVIRDGSGISHVNLVPANEISKLLYSVQQEVWFESYLESLPIAGEENRNVGGTLRHRLKDTATQGNVRAKTGTISTVSSLSGYVKTKSNESLIFSILINNLLDEEDGPFIEDKIVSIIANQ